MVATPWQPELGTDGPGSVLVGVDGSETSWRAAAWAVGLARRSHARLEVVTVLGATALTSLSPAAAQAVRDSQREAADEVRRRLDRVTDEFGVPVRFWILDGDPFGEVARLADEVRADIVVVGASQQAGHRLVGSLAVRLVRHGRWPVSVVP